MENSIKSHTNYAKLYVNQDTCCLGDKLTKVDSLHISYFLIHRDLETRNNHFVSLITLLYISIYYKTVMGQRHKLIQSCNRRTPL